MSEISKQVTSLIDSELSRITHSDLRALDHMQKNASFGALAALTAAAGAGLFAGNMYSDSKLKSRIQELEDQALQRNLLSAGAGALAALKLRKPISGFLAPEPEDLTSLDSDEFDDLWKQRTRRSY